MADVSKPVTGQTITDEQLNQLRSELVAEMPLFLMSSPEYKQRERVLAHVCVALRLRKPLRGVPRAASATRAAEEWNARHPPSNRPQPGPRRA